jgi:hypothetical protein
VPRMSSKPFRCILWRLALHSSSTTNLTYTFLRDTSSILRPGNTGVEGVLSQSSSSVEIMRQPNLLSLPRGILTIGTVLLVVSAAVPQASSLPTLEYMHQSQGVSKVDSAESAKLNNFTPGGNWENYSAGLYGTETAGCVGQAGVDLDELVQYVDQDLGEDYYKSARQNHILEGEAGSLLEDWS